MVIFKPGDLVRCVDIDNWYQLPLTIGNEYIVLGLDKLNQIKIVDNDAERHFYNSDRFILVRHPLDPTPIDNINTRKLSRINQIEL